MAQTDGEAKSLVKWNVLGLASKNISFQYERAVGKKISVALNLGITPKSGLPFKSTIEDIADDDEVSRQIGGLKTGSFSITPEVRFYMGNSALKGFYLAPYVRYTTNSYELPYKFDSIDSGDGSTFERSIFADGNTKVFTGGLMFGSQHKLGGMFYLNWWLGAGIGSISGKVTGTASLNEQEQQEIRDQLNDIDVPLIDLESQVNNNGVRIDVSGTGISARLGLAIGIRF
ncbi:DUF3575 domain-containing protein [Mucilaginibacter limnophilus]